MVEFINYKINSEKCQPKLYIQNSETTFNKCHTNHKKSFDTGKTRTMQNYLSILEASK